MQEIRIDMVDNATSVPHTTIQRQGQDGTYRRNSCLKDVRRILDHLPTAVHPSGNQTIEDRVELRRQRRRKARIRRDKGDHKIEIALRKLGKRDFSVPTKLQVDGTVTTVRGKWLEEAYRFGCQRFGDDCNQSETQAERIQSYIDLLRN